MLAGDVGNACDRINRRYVIVGSGELTRQIRPGKFARRLAAAMGSSVTLATCDHDTTLSAFEVNAAMGGGQGALPFHNLSLCECIRPGVWCPIKMCLWHPISSCTPADICSSR
jgi:hypothetical protein